MPWGRSHTAEEYRHLQELLVSKLVVMLDGYGHVSYKIPMLQELVGLREKDLGKNGFLCSRGNTRFCIFYNFQLSSFVSKLKVFGAKTKSFRNVIFSVFLKYRFVNLVSACFDIVESL
mgnify:CR=1 FL=1